MGFFSLGEGRGGGGGGGGRSQYLVFAQSKFWASVQIDLFYFASELEEQSESKGIALGET